MRSLTQARIVLASLATGSYRFGGRGAAHALLGSRSYYIAGPWSRFRRVIWLLVAPTTLFVLVNAIINACRMVDHVMIMTRGGPDNATMLLLLYVYETGFRFWDTGYAAAISVVLLIILALVGIGQFVLLDRKVHYR